MLKKILPFVLLLSCSSPSKKDVPVIGFLDLLEDATLSRARLGFYDALSGEGFDEKKNTVRIIYRNAQGDQPSLLQACDYLLSQDVKLIATNPTLSTITAVKKTSLTPVFMMVSPRPDLAGLTSADGKNPPNLFGVYETLDYLDTSLMLIPKLFPAARRIGTIYNPSEPQSVDALDEITRTALAAGLQLIPAPVTSSSETQLIVQSLLNRKIDAFFALPDNVVFASMEAIVKSCDQAHIPVFTSEEGLVLRGALAAYGADMYAWGFQSGKQAAAFLKKGNAEGFSPEPVQERRKVFNRAKANFFSVLPDSSFIPVP